MQKASDTKYEASGSLECQRWGDLSRRQNDEYKLRRVGGREEMLMKEDGQNEDMWMKKGFVWYVDVQVLL